MRREHLYLALMLLAGAVIGALVMQFPALREGAVSPLFVIILISLILDLAIMRLPGAHGVDALPMAWRVIGFVGAGGLYLILSQA